MKSYSYDPTPPPDHIVRTVKRINLEDGTYEGEVDEQDRPDGRGIKVAASYFYKGYFMNGKRNGRGKELSVTGIYNGEW